ncbi:hypothetical protein CVA01_21810 [Corynebacterium variabile]|uniref:Uncharacterized protein n=1 Tax=Corynebacterium variabile TaxID=1727 RepID=A0A4Y4C771_9CORY|nr:hypothetical protein CVA01_21810 [Corynebacterium variabile]
MSRSPRNRATVPPDHRQLLHPARRLPHQFHQFTGLFQASCREQDPGAQPGDLRGPRPVPAQDGHTVVGQCVDLGQRGRRVCGGGQGDIHPVGTEPVGQPSAFPVERCAVGPGVPHGVLVGGTPHRIVPVPVPQFRQGVDRVAGGWQRSDTGQHQRTRCEGDRMQTDAVPQVSGGFAGCGERGMLR